MADNTVTKMTPVGAFFNELLLFSGQYALFYILMNFTYDKLNYFANLGHTVLLLILFVQTSILVKFGKKPTYRFLGSLIAPLCYSIFEMREGLNFLLNTGHIFFWVFSIITGLLQAFEIKASTQKLKLVLEFLVTNINVITFVFIYFFFDLKLTFSKQLAAGVISESQYLEYLEVYNIKDG
ncbi:MAG: hypothetical protein ABIK68_21350, partial [bacterium]